MINQLKVVKDVTGFHNFHAKDEELISDNSSHFAHFVREDHYFKDVDNSNILSLGVVNE